MGNLDLGEITLQEFGAADDILINVGKVGDDEASNAAALAAVKAEIDDEVEEYRRTEFVGPRVGEELREAGLLATTLALLGIALYVWFRFEWQFGVAALAALVHDVISTLGFFAITQIEFNLTTLAAVLTVAGYSINDTVVIFDRVREMLRKYKREPLIGVLNRAVIGTLTRSFLTSATTLVALIALVVFGGEVILGFASGLIWGIVIGTFSSVGTAVPILLVMRVRDQTPEESGVEATS